MQDQTRVVVQVVKTPDELSALYRLRYHAYLRKGYIPPDASGTKIDEWDELPSTIQFAAMLDGNIVGGVRLVLDSPHGLPMERTFQAEVTTLRANGRKLAEASALVVSPDGRGADQRTWLRLSRAVWHEAETRNVDDLCIAVTREHLTFYERLLFETIGGSRPYAALNSISAYPLRLALSGIRARHGSSANRAGASVRRPFLERKE